MNSRDACYSAAFDEIFGAARAFALRMLGHPSLAEDIAAEACARAYVHWRSIGEVPHRTAWVLRVTSNLAIDAARKRKQPSVSSAPAPAADDPALRITVAAALHSLPKRQRQAVALRFYADLSEREVAEALGVSTNSVKTHTRRGLAALRDLWGGQNPLEVGVGS